MQQYGELRMIALAPDTGILYCVAFVDRGEARSIISLRRANRRYMQLEGLQALSDTVPTRLSAVAR